MNAPPPKLRGRLETAEPTRIAGWAMDPAAPGEAVALELLIDGAPMGRLVARTFRADLAEAGIGEGRHAFVVTIPHGLPEGAHEVSLRHAGDGRELEGSPRQVEGGAAGDGWQAALGEAARRAEAATAPAEIERLLAALAEQAAALLMAEGSALPEPIAARLDRFAGTPLPPRPAESRPQALFIDEGVPAARRDAGSNAALSHMQSLQRLGFRVHFVAAAGMDRAGERSIGLERLGITCWHAPWVGSVEEVLRRLGPRLNLVYLHRYGVMQRYGALVRRWAPGARLAYCVADLHHLRAARRFAVEAGLPPDAPDGVAAAAGLRTAELLAALGSDAVITHSSHEAELLRRAVPEAGVHLVPWAVSLRPGPAGPGSRRGVAFVGSYGHPPNLDAAYELLERVMPAVWAEAPDIELVLAGSDLPASLRAAAGRVRFGRVRVEGWVEDLDALLDGVRLTAAPLRYGAGLKGKVLDSLAAGVPCLCSPMAAEGMDLPPALGALVCGDAEAMAEAILRLHSGDAAWAALREAGLAWVGEALAETRIDGLLGQAVLSA